MILTKKTKILIVWNIHVCGVVLPKNPSRTRSRSLNLIEHVVLTQLHPTLSVPIPGPVLNTSREDTYVSWYQLHCLKLSANKIRVYTVTHFHPVIMNCSRAQYRLRRQLKCVHNPLSSIHTNWIPTMGHHTVIVPKRRAKGTTPYIPLQSIANQHRRGKSKMTLQ